MRALIQNGYLRLGIVLILTAAWQFNAAASECNRISSHGSSSRQPKVGQVAVEFRALRELRRLGQQNPGLIANIPPSFKGVRQEGSWAHRDASLSFLITALDQALLWHEDFSADYPERSLHGLKTLSKFIQEYLNYFEDYIARHLPRYRKQTAHLASLYQHIVRKNLERGENQPHKASDASISLRANLSGLMGEITALIELPNVQTFGFHLEDILSKTVQSQISSLMKPLVEGDSFSSHYPRIATMLETSNSRASDAEKLQTWLFSYKEFDLLIKSGATTYLVDIKNSRGLTHTKDISKQFAGKSKSILDQIEEDLEIKAMTQVLTQSKAPLFEIGVCFPKGLSPNARQEFENRGVRVFDIRPLKTH